MPPIFLAIAVAVIDAAEALAPFLAPLLATGASLVLGQIAKMFQKGPSSGSLSSQVASRTMASRPALSPDRD